jgi:hypothetical protein
MKNDIEESKRKLQFQINDSEMFMNMNCNKSECNSSLWIKHWENDIKYNKLLLLRLTIIDSLTKEVDQKIGAKIKQCLFDSMETLQELVDANELDENLYLESVNDLQRLFKANEKIYE